MLEERHASSSSSDPGDAEDAGLLARIADGDREAFRALYTKYYHLLLRFMFGITRDHDAARARINDVMLAIWTSSAQFPARSRVRTWIMGIAYREALRHAEAAQRWTAHFGVSLIEKWHERFGTKSGSTSDLDMSDLLEYALGRLSAKNRAVIELTYRYGYSYEEIAAIVACPVPTVKSRMTQARKNIAEMASRLFAE
jgi:RNA polymerase sigma factor (sigma-70 family)